MTETASPGLEISRQTARCGSHRGSPIQKKGHSPRSAAQAPAATSGPIPAGSPGVSATGLSFI